VILLIYFLLAAGSLLYFAKRLTISGECLGDRLGLDSTLIGAILLASITSLPELITSGASAYMGNESMAVANIFGSNIFNLSIIFFLDIFILKGCHIIGEVDRNSSLNMLKGLIVATVLFIIGFKLNLTILRISVVTPVIFLVCLRFFKGEEGSQEECRNESFTEQLIRFLIDSVGVVVLAIILSKLADRMAVTPVMGITLGQTAVGGFFLALTTSLPEFMVCIEAIKRKNYNIAMGNILGSNLFNLATFILLDLLTKESIYRNLSELKVSIIIGALLMHVILFVGVSIGNRYLSLVMGMTYMYFSYISI